MAVLNNFFNSVLSSDYIYLFSIAVILVSTKLFGLASRRIHMPAVVGALVAGIILGPSVLGIVKQSEFLSKTSEIGVILLMFLAGLTTDLDELKQTGKASLIIAVVGVIVPLIGGFIAYYFFFHDSYVSDPMGFLKALFIGVTLTATSVSITVETLSELGKLRSKMGTTILGAAIIDDIVGIVVLTLATSMADKSVNIGVSVIKIVLFFVFVALLAIGVIFGKKIIQKAARKKRTAIYVLAFCLLLSFIAEAFFGVADITGAYFAGLLLCNFGIREYIDENVSVLGYLFFSPIFFASIGITTDLRGITSQLLIFGVLLMLVAIITKILGCGVSAKFCGFNTKDALTIGAGMVSRGEVALIVANKGASYGLVESSMFPAIVLVVIVTTLITPVLLKLCIGKDDSPHVGSLNDEFVELIPKKK